MVQAKLSGIDELSFEELTCTRHGLLLATHPPTHPPMQQARNRNSSLFFRGGIYKRKTLDINKSCVWWVCGCVECACLGPCTSPPSLPRGTLAGGNPQGCACGGGMCGISINPRESKETPSFVPPPLVKYSRRAAGGRPLPRTITPR